MFQNITITQYNKLIVNYDTYEFTPSNYKQIVIDDPWYIDTQSAPDFTQFNYSEINTLKISMPEDVYSVKNKTRLWHQNSPSSIYTYTKENAKHEDIIKGYCNQFSNNISYTINVLEYFVVIAFKSGIQWTPIYLETPDSNSAILLPICDEQTYRLNQMFPLVKTITLTLDITKHKEHVDAHSINYRIYNKSSTTLSIEAGDYTYADYMNKLTSKISVTISNSRNTFKKYKHYNNFRFGNNTTVQWFQRDFNKYYGILHCYPTFNSMNQGHQCVYSANSRCMTISSGDWVLADFMNHVNTSKHGFNLTSDHHNIYISYKCNFIINPVCNIVDDVTDTSSTYGNNKILCAHPQYKLLNCTVNYKGTSHTCNERLTPAEFLRWMYKNVGVKCRVTKDVITCIDNLDVLNVTVSDNPYFEFKENGVVVNKCGMSCNNYKVNIVSDNFYNPELDVYSVINITDNIKTALNSRINLIQ